MDIKNVTFGGLESFNVIVEIPSGSNEKFEYDEASGQMKVDFIFKDLSFPFNYGFIAGTLGGDGDQLDAIVLSAAAINSGTIVKCKAIGILQTIDRGEVDDKIICVPLQEPIAHEYQDISDLPADTLQKWTEFYMEVARQKKKTIEIVGLENKHGAEEEINNSLS